MARPIKEGLDYFPLDVSLDDDVELLEAEHGLSGFAILIKLWQKIYRSGYYIKWDEDICMLFARKINSESTLVSSVINSCLKRDIFKKPLFTKFGILTSRGIQKRFFLVFKISNRTHVKVNKDFMLINLEETKINSEFIELTQELSTQSKVKESKVKEKKRKHGSHVSLSGSEYQKLTDGFGKNVTDSKIEDVNLWCGSKGKTYKDYYKAILVWFKKDGVGPGGPGGPDDDCTQAGYEKRKAARLKKEKEAGMP